MVGRKNKSNNSISLEERVAKEMKWGKVQGIVLTSLAVAGVLTSAVLIPNAAGVLSKYARTLIAPSSHTFSVKRALYALRKKGLVEFFEGAYRLTERGSAHLQKIVYQLDRYQPEEQARRWDGKWRIVLFDVDEKKRWQRDKLRIQLERFGFRQFQKSVWVYPYPCEELVALLKIDLTLRRQLMYLIADALEGDEALRVYFHLPASKNS